MKEKAIEICRRFYLGDGAKKLLAPELNTEQYLKALIENKQFTDAVRVMAYALPIERAIAWASFCAHQASQNNPSAESRAALEAVDKWMSDHTDENRRAAMKAAESGKFDTAAGSAALAVFFSGGSIAPPGAPVTAPDETMTPNSVFNAVMLSVLSKEPERAEEKYHLFLAEGQKLAMS